MVKVGIAGAGIRGEMYAAALAWIPDAEFVAICDPNEKRAADIAQRFDAASYSDFRQMFAAGGLEAVIVATPDFAHRDIAVAAAKAGLHMMIEKPVATTVTEANEIRDAVRQAGVQCMIAFENRWHQAFVHAHNVVANGDFGDVLTQNIILSNSYFVPTKMIPWAAQSSVGWFLMCHTVDLAVWLSGKKVSKVFARGSRGVLVARGVDTWDVIHALLTFEDGSTVNLTSTWVLPDASPTIVEFRYQAIGDRAALNYELSGHGLRYATAESYKAVPLVGSEIDGRLQAPPIWMLQSFVEQLAAGKPVSPSIDEGVTVTEIVAAIHRSLDDGTEKQLV